MALWRVLVSCLFRILVLAKIPKLPLIEWHMYASCSISSKVGRTGILLPATALTTAYTSLWRSRISVLFSYYMSQVYTTIFMPLNNLFAE